MDEKLKHRLVGFAVFIALSVIFLPLWLDMKPAPGTRLEDVKIPPRPEWHFFNSEKEEQQQAIAQLKPIAPELPNAVNNAANTTAAVAPSLNESLPPITENKQKAVTEQTKSVTELKQLPSTELPQQQLTERTKIYTTDIKPGTSLNGTLAKAGVSNEQIQSLLKLGSSLKGLDTLQSGRKLWVKTGPQNEIQQIIYYGPGNKIYSHIMRRGNTLQVADNNSAINTLNNKPLENNKILDSYHNIVELKSHDKT